MRQRNMAQRKPSTTFGRGGVELAQRHWFKRAHEDGRLRQDDGRLGL
jgi:hypothetical protein